MKRFGLLIALNVFFAHMLFAQSMYTSAVQTLKLPASSRYHNPIAKWTDTQSIMYLKKDVSTMYFCLIDHADFMNPPSFPISAPMLNGKYTKVMLPPGYTDMTINDIYCCMDYAFFCGTIYNGIWMSVVGFFDITELESQANTNFNFYILAPGTTKPPTGLDRLVAYNTATGFDVVAFGDEMSAPGSTPDFSQTKIVEIKDLISTVPASCDVADLDYYPTPSGTGAERKQYVDDIFLTQNYVVLTGHGWRSPVGTVSTSDMYIHYLFGKKGVVLQDITSYMNNNRFCPIGWESNDTVMGVALEEDIFAISYVHAPNGMAFLTRVRVIDPLLHDNTYSVEYPLPQKYNPIRMVYHSGLNAVEILQPVYNASDFTMIDLGNTSSFVAPVLNYTSYRHYSMHGMHGNCFISSHENQIYLQNRSAALPPSTPGCPNVDFVNVSQIEPLQMLPRRMPRLRSCMINPESTASPNLQLDIINDCFSVE